MTRTGDREIRSVSGRLLDNPGELAYMDTSTSQTKSATRSRFDVSSTTDKSCEQAPFWRLNMVKAMGDRAEAVPACTFRSIPAFGPYPHLSPRLRVTFRHGR